MARARRPDAPSLVAGLGLIAVGGILLADRLGALELSFAALAPIACALVGAILVASGATRRR